jgi:hypothetical protein
MGLFACHLAGIPHSGLDPEFWQNIPLQQKPNSYNPEDDQHIAHFVGLFSYGVMEKLSTSFCTY